MNINCRNFMSSQIVNSILPMNTNIHRLSHVKRSSYRSSNRRTLHSCLENVLLPVDILDDILS